MHHDSQLVALERPGTEFAGFRVIRSLGRGRTSSVLLVEAMSDRPGGTRGSRFALKILSPRACAVGGPAVIAGPERETQLSRAARHPNLAEALESGRFQRGDGEYSFLVRELVVGCSLRTRLDDEVRLPEADVRTVGAQLLRGLEALHAAGGLHLDLKPENVLLAEDGTVKLVDFGHAPSRELVAASPAVGSPLYSSPEQLAGGELGAWCDLYAAGVVLLEAASGHVPFDGASETALVAQKLDGPVWRPDRPVSPLLRELIDELLDPDVSRRPAAAVVADTLEGGEDSSWWRARNDDGRRTHSPERSLPGLSSTGPARTIGRAHELDRLLELLADVHSRGPRLLLIEGEAGIGKSRLLAELEAEIGRRGLAPCIGRSGYQPSQLGGSAAAAAIHDALGSRLEEELARLPGGDARRAAAASFLTGRDLTGDVSPIATQQQPALLAELARSLAREGPLLLIIEDLHFGAPDAADQIARMAAGLRDSEVLVVVTTRPCDDGRTATLSQPTWERMPLEPLPPLAVLELLEEIVGRGVVSRGIPDQFVAAGAGNPLFLLELCRDLERRGELGRSLRDGLGLERPASITVPGAVRAVLRQRLDGLGDEPRAVLEAAAVAGFTFSPRVVADVLGLSINRVLAALGTLSRDHSLLSCHDDYLAFRHHLLHASLHAEIADERRRQLHRDIAQRLPPDADPGLVLHHAIEGHDIERATALYPTTLRRISDAGRSDAVVSLGEALLELVPSSRDEDRARLGLAIGKAYFKLGRPRDACVRHDAALAAAGRAGTPRLANEIRCELGLTQSMVGDDRAHSTLSHAASQAREQGDEIIELRTLGRLGAVLVMRGELAKARDVLEEAVSLLSRMQRSREATGSGQLGNLGIVYALLGEPLRAHPLMKRSLEATRAFGDRLSECEALGDVCELELRYLGNVPAARGRIEDLLAIVRAREVASPRRFEILGNRLLAMVLHVEGRLGDAARRVQQARRLLDEDTDAFAESAVWLMTGLIAEADGAPGEAKEALDRAVALGAELHAGPSILLARARLALADEPELARRLLRRAEDQVVARELRDPGPLPSIYLKLLGDRPRGSIDVPDGAPLDVAAEAHLRLFELTGDPRHRELSREPLERLSAHLPPAGRRLFWEQHPVAVQLSRIGEDEAGP